MKRTLIFIAVSVVLSGCNKKSVDLSKIDFTENADKYLCGLKYSSKKEQNGHYEVVYNGNNVFLELKDDGEKVITYEFTEKHTKPLNYAGLRIDGNLICTKIKVYNGKICYISTDIDENQTFEMVNLLKERLGKPAEIITREMPFNENSHSLKLLLEKLHEDTRKMKDDMVVSYPEYYIWATDDIIFQLTIAPLKTGCSVKNGLYIISRKALRDKVILGFHNPKNDPILSKYVE